jgi:hypothetical protein
MCQHVGVTVGVLPAETVSMRRIAGPARRRSVVLFAGPIFTSWSTPWSATRAASRLRRWPPGGRIPAVAGWLWHRAAWHHRTGGPPVRPGDRSAAVAEGVQGSLIAVGVGVAMAVLARSPSYR